MCFDSSDKSGDSGNSSQCECGKKYKYTKFDNDRYCPDCDGNDHIQTGFEGEDPNDPRC